MKALFKSAFEQMKTKNFYILVVFISVTSLSLWFVSYPSPTFRNIMSTTQNNIRKIPQHMQMSSTAQLEVDKTFLQLLGFTENKGYTFSEQQMVIGSAMLPGTLEDIESFLDAAHTHVPSRSIVLFDMGLSKSNTMTIGKMCNETTSCSVKPFLYNKYPSHVQDLSTKSYKPICIQLLLEEFGSVIWADTSEHFMTSNMNKSILQAKEIGLVAWTIKDPTSSLTHPKMFDYFKTKQDKYYFHRAVQSSHLIIYNNKKIHHDLMLPWVKCALVEECINPTGAQNSGCNYQRKPLFRYSGCHWYDMSALNVILGIVFDFGDSYSGTEIIFATKYDIDFGNSTGITRASSSTIHRVYV